MLHHHLASSLKSYNGISKLSNTAYSRRDFKAVDFKAEDFKAEDFKAVDFKAELLSNIKESLLEWRWVGRRLIKNRFFG